jgi:hypothetical protein
MVPKIVKSRRLRNIGLEQYTGRREMKDFFLLFGRQQIRIWIKAVISNRDAAKKCQGCCQIWNYRWPSLFADFLFANSHNYIGKNGPKLQFSSQKLTFYLRIKILGPKWRNVSTANNKGNLYFLFIDVLLHRVPQFFILIYNLKSAMIEKRLKNTALKSLNQESSFKMQKKQVCYFPENKLVEINWN